MNNHLIVVSVDAMVSEDIKFVRSLNQYFNLILSNGVLVNKVSSIFPSLTHPVHASIMTGCRPKYTGVSNNELFLPFSDIAPWYNKLNQLKVDSIFDIAHNAGLTTAACRWPMTDEGENIIDYLVPELLPADVPNDADIETIYKKHVSKNIFDDVVKPNLHILNRNEKPWYDEFSMQCASEITKKYKPDIIFCHPGIVDSARHKYGLFNEEVNKALILCDKWLGWLVEATKEAGIYDNTNFVILSDHGQMEIKRTICLNVILYENGFIRSENGKATPEWDAYITSCGLSAEVFLKDPSDSVLYNKVFTLLKKLERDGVYGFTRVYTKEEAEEIWGLSGDFSFVLEGDGYTAFSDEYMRPLLRPIDNNDYRKAQGTHGHNPLQGPQPIFFASGPNFRKGVVLDNCSILDEAPTFARIFGLDMPNAEGKPLTHLLKMEDSK